MAVTEQQVPLPPPSKTGEKTLEQLLQQRRSVREYRRGDISVRELSQLLWAAQGITSPQGYRTAPSAGALYPLELYVLAGNVRELQTGLYHYRSSDHQLIKLNRRDLRKVLAKAAFEQLWLQQAELVVIFAAVYERTTGKYGSRGVRYVHMDSGFAAENLFLQAESLGLGTVVVGAFDDAKVAELLHLPAEVKPLLLMPVGRK